MAGPAPGFAPGFAPAKVNLALHVTGRRTDGYHLLDSVVVFADFGDVLTAAHGDGLVVTGPFAAGVPTGDDNLVRRALALAGTSRAVTLDKRLPHPGGIGGGSSDAAAVLRLVGARPATADLLALGADLPVCLAGHAARMRGIGEVVEPLDLPELPALLVHPGIAVPTSAVFAQLGAPSGDGLGDVPRSAGAGDLAAWLAKHRNDLETPAVRIAPAIGEALSALRHAGAHLARMSGSGATCFGLFPDLATARAAAASLARPGWWVRPCLLNPAPADTR